MLLPINFNRDNVVRVGHLYKVRIVGAKFRQSAKAGGREGERWGIMIYIYILLSTCIYIYIYDVSRVSPINTERTGVRKWTLR